MTTQLDQLLRAGVISRGEAAQLSCKTVNELRADLGLPPLSKRGRQQGPSLTPRRVKNGAKVRVTAGSVMVGSVGYIVGPDGSMKPKIDFGHGMVREFSIGRLQLLSEQAPDQAGEELVATAQVEANEAQLSALVQALADRKKKAKWNF